MIWFVERWLEVTSIAIAIAALIFAALAHSETKKAALATEASNIASVRVQAKSCFAEVDRSFFALQSACRENEMSWKSYQHKHLPKLTLRQPQELQELRFVERDAAKLLRELQIGFDDVDKMNASQLEDLIQETRTAAIQIERLSQRLTEPPFHLH